MNTNGNPYLILHKVRGEGAFDIAVKMEMANGELVWIIPTSGHRAYPYWHEELSTVLSGGGPDVLKDGYLGAQWRSPPADWPDHYAYLDKKPSRGTTPTHPKLEDI